MHSAFTAVEGKILSEAPDAPAALVKVFIVDIITLRIVAVAALLTSPLKRKTRE